jgi:predicted dehydrogenase
MSAMQRGINAYVQKPLAHDLYEVRRLTEFAREKKLVTQMGIQIHSTGYYRIGVKVIQQGAIGKVKEVHSWSSKKWGDLDPLPAKSDPIPKSLNWDLWLGVCAERPYINDYYHPGNWRKRLDFGTGTFGDMGCHIFDPVFAALALTAPISVRSEGPSPNKWNWSVDSVIHYVFPGTEYTEGPMVPVHWYDGDQRPSKDVQAVLGKRELPDQGSLFIGTKGAMLLPHIEVPSLYPVAEFKDYKLPRDPGTSHYKQFIDAVLAGNPEASSARFDYSGPLTESVLLGGVATRFPKTTLEWDAAKVVFKNCPDAKEVVRRTYRKGWEIKGLS